MAMLLASCGNASAAPLPEGDGYIDALPQSMDDGTFLQAFNWKYTQVMENLPTLADQGFKGVQISPVQVPKGNGSQWYFFYQPLSFTVADKSPLGTKEELRELCTEADKYGISIIVDVVANHMAATGEKDSNGIPIVDPAVREYEPTLYDGRLTYFHQSPQNSLSGSGAVTQYYQYGVLPDLNTGNEYVQERVLSFLKECIDVGIDGFRFDAAKHIETPRDPSYASDFWPNTLGVAKEYYKTKTGADLFAYGETLGGLDGGRNDLSIYTDYMKLTDDGYITQINSGISSNAELVATADFAKKTDHNNLITWVFSHDSYEKTGATEESFYKRYSRQWAVLASRKGSNPMLLARPDEDKTVGKIAYYDFEKPSFGAINRFHNRFIGAEENLYALEDLNVFVNERTSANQNGAMLVNVKPNSGLTKNVTFEKLPDGEYFDQLTNKLVVVKDSKAKITFDATGVCVLTKTNNSKRPSISVNKTGCNFQNSIKITIIAKNSTKSYYQLNDGEKKEFNGSTSITITSEGVTKLFIHAEREGTVVERVYNYKKINISSNGFNIVNLNPSYLTDYALYYWAWPERGSGKWYNDYTVVDKNVIIEFPSGLSKFLLAIFPKGYKITNVNAWDSKVIKQTGDIDISLKYYDAADF